MSFLGCKRARTTAYHPQANGMAERFHRQLKCALKAQTNAKLIFIIITLGEAAFGAAPPRPTTGTVYTILYYMFIL